MKKKVAILIDGEWFRKELEYTLYPSLARKAASAAVKAGQPPVPSPIPNGITASIMYKNALAALRAPEEECFRIFYYDAEPFEGKVKNPLDGSVIDYTASPVAHSRRRFFQELGKMDLVALRRGECRARGWQLRDSFLKRRIKAGNAPVQLAASDIAHSLTQKGVDMRIGMDVATLSLKRIVDRLLLISGDTDLVPALKLARREGLQVGLVCVRKNSLHGSLIEDSDFVRAVTAST